MPVIKLDVKARRVLVFVDQAAWKNREALVMEEELVATGVWVEYAECRFRVWWDRKGGRAGFAKVGYDNGEKWLVEAPVEIGVEAGEKLAAPGKLWARLEWMKEFLVRV